MKVKKEMVNTLILELDYFKWMINIYYFHNLAYI